jgi:hypothetical protein
MNKPQWLHIVKVIQAIGITCLGLFFVLNLPVYMLFLGGLVSIFASIAEWVIGISISKFKINPIPLVAFFFKLLLILAIVFRGLTQNTEISFYSFAILYVVVILIIIFQVFVYFHSRKKKDINTLDD